jgi:hemoglobin/transferrin/lactoferrin receptor protein
MCVRKAGGRIGFEFGKRIAVGLLSGPLLFGAAVAATVALAQAQEASQQSFSIAPGSLAQALAAFGKQSGLQITYASELTAGKQSPGVSGTMAPESALTQILSGSGLIFSYAGASTVAISEPAADAGATIEGAIALDTITVSGGGAEATVDLPYETPGSSAYISAEQIERFRGTSPGDIFKNTAGVMVGENHNSGALDVNIRGMQGANRVPVMVEGMFNTTTVQRGYQGVASRSYVDPDFIAGVEIEKGPSFGGEGTGAIGGVVSMRMISAGDIVRDDNLLGLRLKGGVGNNVSDVPELGTTSLMVPWGGRYASDDVERPDFFDFESRYGSAVIAFKSDYLEILAGAARRKSGNYHAGENGSGAAKDLGPYNGRDHSYAEPGLTPYLGGEEVLNTSEETSSKLFRAKLKLDEGHTLELISNHYESEFGETYPMNFSENTDIARQAVLSTADLDGRALRYRWNPADIDLIDLKINGSSTDLVEYSAPNGGLVGIGKWSKVRRGDISNTARFATGVGEFVLEGGASYLNEETGPTEDSASQLPPSREGERWETSMFGNTQWSPVDWLRIDGGVRYQEYETEDKLWIDIFRSEPKSDEAVGFTTGVTVMPVEGLQIFALYKDAPRFPSLLESTGGFLLAPNPEIGPERAHNWEFGANLMTHDVALANDDFAVKATYFDNTVDDYISRKVVDYYGTRLQTDNVARAKFSGFELSSRYRVNTFSAEVSGTYYTNVEFCRTLATCSNSSLASDYATNYIPPKYSASLTVSNGFFDDTLTLGGRLNHVGPRAADAESPLSGAAQLIALIDWEPYTVVDVFGEYKLNEHMTLGVSVENVGDLYYIEPLNLGLIPSPGRTARADMTLEF